METSHIKLPYRYQIAPPYGIPIGKNTVDYDIVSSFLKQSIISSKVFKKLKSILAEIVLAL